MQKKLDQFYSNNFYSNQMTGSYNSATLYLNFLKNYLDFESVCDIGCGRGTWLKAAKEIGAKNLFGFDGNWNSASAMVDSDISFLPVDLNLPINFPGKCDLAISLEVAEHLKPSSSNTLVQSLTGMADVILFGAAFTGQGGANHINEQPCTYWARLFLNFGYVPFDLLRPHFWLDDRIEFWYRQNTFIYVRTGSIAFETLSKRVAPLSDIGFMDCVHPELYLKKMEPPSFRESLAMVRQGLSMSARNFVGAIGRRFRTDAK